MANRNKRKPGIYRAERVVNDVRLIKYAVANSVQDASERAVKFDDPCWAGARFVFVESCKAPDSNPDDTPEWQRSNQIVVAQS